MSNFFVLFNMSYLGLVNSLRAASLSLACRPTVFGFNEPVKEKRQHREKAENEHCFLGIWVCVCGVVIKD